MTSDSSNYTDDPWGVEHDEASVRHVTMVPVDDSKDVWWDDPGDLPPCPDCRGRCYEDDFDEVPCPRCHGEGVLDVGYML